MTYPGMPEEESMGIEEAVVRVADTAPRRPSSSYPDPILPISDETRDKLTIWVDSWLMWLINDQQSKISQWSDEEKAYRALSDGPRTYPFAGACGDVVPLIAMAVDPIHARLDVGLFKTDRIFRVKALKKSVLEQVEALERWLDYYFRYKCNLRSACQPRLLEFTKHGTMVLKTVYEDDSREIVTYDEDWKTVKKKVTTFKGPKVVGVSINDFLFPPNYQYLQDVPCCAERIRTTIETLFVAQAAGKLKNVEKLVGQEKSDLSQLELEREKSAQHTRSNWQLNDIEVFEVWCRYDIDGDNIPENLVITYHRETKTILQLRYNWYFHQKYPYTLMPYQITNDSLYGIGLAEMIKPFQDTATQWHRMATDNAYLANIRMFIAKKDSGIEEAPKLYSGRVFYVDDPSKDFVPFAAADIYQSTLQERQNLLGLSEKRTGVSDYLTGRESPIVGSRATATSTLALIKEGTQRVEEVLENIRAGLQEVVLNCISIWDQYGLSGLDDLVFGDDDMLNDLKDFFENIDQDNVNGAVAVDIAANDAANNRQVQQQMALAIIQTMMQYLQKVLEAGQAGLEAAQTMPEYTQMVGEVMTAARRMFRDLLIAYNIPNPEEYLPDLEAYLDGALKSAASAAQQPNGGGVGGQPNAPAGAPAPSGLQLPSGQAAAPAPAMPSPAGIGV